MFLRNRFRWRNIGALRAWTPAALGSDLALWLDAADAGTITLNGSTVSQWSDKSGNARHATQGTAARQPQFVLSAINNRPVVSSDGIDDSMSIANSNEMFAGISSATIALVGQFKRINSNDIFIFGSVGTSLRIAIGSLATGNVVRASTRRLDADAVSTASGGTVVQNVPQILAGNYNYSAGSLSINQNGTQVGTASFTAGITSSTTGPSVLFATTAGVFYPVDIGEIVVVNAEIPNIARQRLEGYLAWKWSGYL